MLTVHRVLRCCCARTSWAVEYANASGTLYSISETEYTCQGCPCEHMLEVPALLLSAETCFCACGVACSYAPGTACSFLQHGRVLKIKHCHNRNRGPQSVHNGLPPRLYKKIGPITDFARQDSGEWPWQCQSITAEMPSVSTGIPPVPGSCGRKLNI